MVNISEKIACKRISHARGEITLPIAVMNELFKESDISPTTKKGSVFTIASIAGIMAAKKTAELIPLCHNIQTDSLDVTLQKISESVIQIDCKVQVEAKTGAEMEAMVGVSVAALTVYDMCKGMSHDISIRNIRLVSKTGGKSDYS